MRLFATKNSNIKRKNGKSFSDRKWLILQELCSSLETFDVGPLQRGINAISPKQKGVKCIADRVCNRQARTASHFALRKDFQGEPLRRLLGKLSE